MRQGDEKPDRRAEASDVSESLCFKFRNLELIGI